MADELSIINNPDPTPGDASTGYGAQNTNIVAHRVGVDETIVTGALGSAVLSISGPVDVNGVLYTVTSSAIFSISVAGRYFIYLSGSGDNLTPVLSTDSGTFDESKNARYTSLGYRVLNWCLDSDGSDISISRLLTPEHDELGEAANYIPNLDATQETYISVSGTWVAPRSKYYKIYVTGKGGDTPDITSPSYVGGGGSGLTGIRRIFIPAGDLWTASFSSSSGGNTTFSNGTTTLSAQNGYDATLTTTAGASAGAGGTANSGFDIFFPGNYGDSPSGSTPIRSGGGAASYYGDGPGMNSSSLRNALPGLSYGSGAAGAIGSGNLGASGGPGLIRIIG